MPVGISRRTVGSIATNQSRHDGFSASSAPSSGSENPSIGWNANTGTASMVAAHRLYERLGFEPVAHFREVGFKFGRWLDLMFLQRFLS